MQFAFTLEVNWRKWRIGHRGIVYNFGPFRLRWWWRDTKSHKRWVWFS